MVNRTNFKCPFAGANILLVIDAKKLTLISLKNFPYMAFVAS